MKFGLRLLLLLLALAYAACKPAKETAASSTPLPATPARASPPPGLVFKAYDGDPRKTDPKKMSFQIDWADRRQPSEFLQIGQIVPSTKFRVTGFEYKTRPDPKTNELRDASELTLTNTETNQTCVLTYPTVKDSPPVF